MGKKSTPLQRLIQYARPYKRKIWIATAFSILNKLFDLAPPVLIGAAVDIVVRREGSIFGLIGIENLRTQLYFLSSVTFIIWASESFFEYLYKIYWRNLAQTVQHQLRLDAYNHIQELELEYFEDRHTGGLMSVLNDDINQLERFLDVGSNDIIQVITTVFVISTSFFLLSPQVGLFALIPIPIILIFSFRYQKKLEPRYAAMRKKVGILNERLANNLTGIAAIKSYTNEKYESDRIEDSSIKYQEANRHAITLSSAFSPLIRMVIVAGFISMLIIGGIQTLEGNLEVAAYSVIVFLIQRLLWPLTRLGETFDHYQRAMASTKRVLDLLDTPIKIVPGKKRLQSDTIRGEINFDNISFGYKGRTLVLKDFSVQIPAGDTIAFVGTTGAGKSTLIKLLLRFYDTQEGKIFLDGTDIKELNLKDLRSGIGLVSQDTFLIDGTIRENIAYGRPETPLNQIIDAAKLAEVHEFASHLKEGYDTLVGERGQRLSGGQRQRVSIARAVLKNPSILIFDEATSSVDNETEAAIQRSLEKLRNGRTTIIIAHRLSTIRNVDRIYLLENGRIVEEGVHEALITLENGKYRALWRVQTGEA
ncbi:MAG: ABC transporter ATP-binding protein [Candidatus Scalindua sp. AMX11]|nr:MAG: ABC transporter ATP-binding protein [Candidatus Scalindua sp.]NOG85132.1 ABC transporter ATP-binding protein [Planctomycetota bacterium]RZV67662.1 MAG: ABC transporter ATP-binding protein [Candidatus Scalindua sp. SCAELEC01]TDE63714.1 MAG: ABC transporter ATP-binding protein [Candidatus Scalindua sp. AMX11]GJQ57205.1 MAG: ABC transporter ATP-binding protein [Candidatus Scalindua sp.]